MIRVHVGEGEIRITGHAAYADKGRDIVCAAVSAIIQTAVLGLDAVAREHPDFVAVEISDTRTAVEPGETRGSAHFV